MIFKQYLDSQFLSVKSFSILHGINIHSVYRALRGQRIQIKTAKKIFQATLGKVDLR
jgi:predicted transcriptional regulator